MLKVYGYEKCGSCRSAWKWLDERGISYQKLAIREHPPTAKELKAVTKAMEDDFRKLFNTSGKDYRALGMKDLLPTMTEAEAIAFLEGNGNLVKRPFVIGEGKALVGFKKELWEKAFG